MPTITKHEPGRYSVHDERRTYGVYRSLAMAEYRRAQVENSRRPRPGLRRLRKGA